jgi:hypothetical protein
MAYLLRRKKLGRTSCREISRNSKTGIRTVLNGVDPIHTDPNELCFRWGCTATIPQRNVVNTAEAIHRVSNKTEFRKVLNEYDLCPKTSFFNDTVTANMLPVIVRPSTHHQGRNLYFCQTIDELQKACVACGQDYYVSAFIDKIAEYRVFIVSDRIVCVARKIPADDTVIAWNVAQGGRFENVRFDEWPLRAVRKSVEAFKLSGLDFGGVDIMVDEDDRCYVLEINSAPSLTSPYRQTCFARAFDYIVSNGKDSIPIIQERGGYRKFIHPAITDNAIIP